jgi:hypothetical protein
MSSLLKQNSCSKSPLSLLFRPSVEMATNKIFAYNRFAMTEVVNLK